VTPEQFARVKELFEAAMDLPEAERASYIEHQAGDDAAVRAEVGRLLAERTRSGVLTGLHSVMCRALDRETVSVSAERRAGQMVSHYRLDRRLGTGGMGEVWLADDLALGRRAAIKLLRPDMGDTLRARLVREAQASARLQHPGIATFHESGEEGGLTWLAMEYVQGRTLRDRLLEGALPVEQALGLGETLLEALVHAHTAGVLHRDVKPENAMLTDDGRVKLLDFGLARWVEELESEEIGPEASTVAAMTRLTAHGAVAGTIGYMSPEQLRGEPVDVRTDLFAAGAVLYESLTGRPAFPGRNLRERMAAILSRDPDPLEGPDIPSGLEVVLARSMAREADERYPDAASFLADLRRAGKGRAVSTLPNTLAVIDFDNLSGDPDDDWIGRGLAESLVADLGRVGGLVPVVRENVLNESAALRGEGKEADALALGRRLGCRWVLAGGFQKMGQALRVTMRIIDVGTGGIVAMEKRDGRLEDLFAMQDQLSAAVATSLDLGQASTETAPDLDVYECYERGMILGERFGKDALVQAVDYLQQAIELDPGYAPALAELAKMNALRFGVTGDPRDLEVAADFARRALRSDPSSGQALAWLGYTLWRSGRSEEALTEERRAADLAADRYDPPYFLGSFLLDAGRPAKALPWFQRCLELRPDFSWALLGLAMAHLTLGHAAEARWVCERVCASQSSPGAVPAPGAIGQLAMWHRYHGELGEARRLALENLRDIETSDHVFRDSARASALCGLGEIALRQDDLEAARVAFDQAIAQLRGRSRGAGLGWVMIYALAGQSRATRSEELLDEALRLEESREGFDFSFPGWVATRYLTLMQMAVAAAALGRREQARELLLRSRAAGLSAALEEPLD
jgi:serine/threonine-protein kinase